MAATVVLSGCVPAHVPWAVQLPASSGCGGLRRDMSGNMLFAFDQEHGAAPGNARPFSEMSTVNRDLEQRAAALTSSCTSFETRVFRDLRQLRSAASQNGRCNLELLATKLADLGYHCSTREALGGGHGQACFEQLHHQHLLVGDGFYAVVVDPSFREQFKLGISSARYRAALSIPEEFVGGAGRLTALVEFLCSEMAAAFAAVGMTLPPWRHHRAMLSKWLPSRARTVAVLSAPASRKSSTAACNMLLKQIPALTCITVPPSPLQRPRVPPRSALQLMRRQTPVAAAQAPKQAQQLLKRPKQLISLTDSSASHFGLISRELEAQRSPSVKGVPAPFDMWRRINSAASEELRPRIHTVKLRGSCRASGC